MILVREKVFILYLFWHTNRVSCFWHKKRVIVFKMAAPWKESSLFVVFSSQNVSLVNLRKKYSTLSLKNLSVLLFAQQFRTLNLVPTILLPFFTFNISNVRNSKFHTLKSTGNSSSLKLQYLKI